jgi:TetR/AcrR family transcriptional regulator, mexJK operon transcriptional repressor
MVSKMSRSARSLRPAPGRPTREQAEQRHAQLLESALELFLEHGYELTTIEEIIASIGMHKSTMYSLYPDKKALFLASLQRAIVRWTLPVEAFKKLESDDLEQTLIAIARLRLANTVSAMGLKLQRILIAESLRFPEITQMFWEQGVEPGFVYLTELLVKRASRGEIEVDQPELIAHGFFTLTVGLISRMVLMGTRIDQKAIEKRISLYVKLFLDGVRHRGNRRTR